MRVRRVSSSRVGGLKTLSMASRHWRPIVEVALQWVLRALLLLDRASLKATSS